MGRRSWTWLVAGLLFLACGGSEGPAGPPGTQGPPGPAGTNGTNGTNGAAGANATNGSNGTSADGGSALATCVPNGQIACQCASGATGFQTCAADGLSYGVCACLDGGASNDAGDGGGTISIGTLPGLIAWFKGDKGIVDDLVHPGKVKRWLDQSGNGNDAQQRGGTPVGPTHDPAAVNGIDGVYFDSQTGLEMAVSSSLMIGTDDFAVIFVGKIQSSQYATPFLTNNLLTIEIGPQPGTLGINAAGVTGSVGWPSGPEKWRFFAARGKTLKLQIDDAVAITSSTSTADLTSGGTLWSILPATTGNAATAELAEFLMIKGSVSDADLAKIQASLKAKYNL